MKILSFNCRGLANPNKKSSLRRLVEQCSLDVILLQETLGDNLAVVKILESLLPGWMFTAVDARGCSGVWPL
jgi:exonuclease III